MASIIPGYEYDIFISYRQKDNKGDRWVSEFVESLKTELESTFKEEISVYFDINPHDGLLETHDVNASLKEKLKCLVFIPIISRTYCDPKSFAWEHEFKAFVEQASLDKFGLKVKLPNGNVANRLLPVRIHDLDTDDTNLCETIVGGVLRGVEFIYKEPGVNRPLKSDDDEKININKTKYRNQINKVANAIKEITTGLRNPENLDREILDKGNKGSPSFRKNHRTKIFVGTSILLTMIIAGYLVYPKLIKPAKQLERSIAVLPFLNESPIDTNKYFINGIMEEVLNKLQSIKDCRVLSRTSTEQYSGTNRPTIPKIAKALDVNYIVEGSGQKYGNRFVLRVQLIVAINERHLWGKSYNREILGTTDIFNLQSEIAQAIAGEIKATITPEEKQIIDKAPTANLVAFDFYQRGREEERKYSLFKPATKHSLELAGEMYKSALRYDPTFASAYTGLANVYYGKHYWEEYFSRNFMDSVLILSNLALSFDNQLSDAYTLRGRYYEETDRPDQAINEFDKAIQLNPNSWIAYYQKGLLYDHIDLVKAVGYFQKALSLYHGEQLSKVHQSTGFAFLEAGFPDIAYSHFAEALKLDKDSSNYFVNLLISEFSRGNYGKAVENGNKAISLDSTLVNGAMTLSKSYIFLGKYKESLLYLDKHLKNRKALGLTFDGNMWIMGYIFWKNGYKEKAEYYFDETVKQNNRILSLGRKYSQADIYYDLAGVYAFRGERDKAFENLRIFSQTNCMQILFSTVIKNDPLFNNIRNEPEFQLIVNEVGAKHQAEHERVRKWLEENKML